MEKGSDQTAGAVEAGASPRPVQGSFSRLHPPPTRLQAGGQARSVPGAARPWQDGAPRLLSRPAAGLQAAPPQRGMPRSGPVPYVAVMPGSVGPRDPALQPEPLVGEASPRRRAAPCAAPAGRCAPPALSEQSAGAIHSHALGYCNKKYPGAAPNDVTNPIYTVLQCKVLFTEGLREHEVLETPHH